MNKSPIIENRIARYNYYIEETYVAGMVLAGPEVCSIRRGMVSLNDSWCYITEKNEVMVRNMYITKQANTNIFSNFNEDDERKLLLNKREIKKISKFLEAPGHTIVPLKIYRAENGFFKMLIGLAKGKKDYDKRETIKKRDVKKELAQVIKDYG